MPKDPFFANQPKPEEKTPEEVNETPEQNNQDNETALPSEEIVEEKKENPVQEREEETTEVVKEIIAPTDESTQEEVSEAEEILKEKLTAVKKVTPTVKKVVTPRTRGTQRAGSRFSLRSVMIGCLLFLLLLVGGLSFVFYSMLSNPNQQRTIIPRQSAQDLLITFARVFFVVIFFVGVFFFTINLTRVLSKKRTKKFVYSIGAFMGVMLMLLSIGIGIPTITSITQAGETKVDRVVDPFVLLPDGPTFIGSNPRVLLIAPAKIFYQLNTDVYKSSVLIPLGSPDVRALTLSCGNGQEIARSAEKNGFGPCLYTDKKSYPVTLNLQYVDRQTGEVKQDTRKLADLAMDAKVDIEIVDGEITSNDDNTELILGEAPVKLRLDAQDIVSTFGLVTNDINWDIDEDNEYETTQTAIIKQQFLRSKQYTIKYKIPGISPYTYVFEGRVLQPETPVCQVNVTQQSDSVYRFDVQFVEGNEKISQYKFGIKDLLSSNIVEEEQARSNSLQYDFTRGGEYAIKVTFITQDGKTGGCESDDFMVGDIAYEVTYDMTARGPGETKFQAIDDGGVFATTDGIRLTQLPTTIRLTDIEIFPRTSDTTVTILLDGEAVLEKTEGTYDITITTQGDHELKVQSTDEETGQSTVVETFAITTDLQGVIGKLLVRPNTVGTEPFEVEFDASTTTINDPDDEVVYFTRDFGDGEIKKNINQAIIKHTYYFDEEIADGRYSPKLVITTKKGRELTVELDSPIIVKRSLRDARISIDSHPGQIARVGESIQMSLTADGIPSRVIWTFAPEDILECTARSCMEAIRTFDEAGTYDIRVRVEYEDHPDVLDSVQLVVN